MVTLPMRAWKVVLSVSALMATYSLSLSSVVIVGLVPSIVSLKPMTNFSKLWLATLLDCSKKPLRVDSAWAGVLLARLASS